MNIKCMEAKNRLYLAILLLLVTLSACTQTQAKSQESGQIAEAGDVKKLVEASETAYTKGDFDEAVDLARQAMQLAPSNFMVLEAYEQAVLGKAGNKYLQNLPQDRYRLSPEDFLTNQANGQNYFILDVREPDEFAEGHIENAVNLPLREVLQQIDTLPENKNAPILVYCRSQKRSTHALVVLRQLGYTEVYNLKDGILAYQEFLAENPQDSPAGNSQPDSSSKPVPISTPEQKGPKILDESDFDDC